MRMEKRGGREILVVDISDCSLDEFWNIIKKSKKIIRNAPKKSILVLAVTGANTPIFTDKNRFIEYMEGNEPFIKASAIVHEGANTLVKDLLISMLGETGRNIPFFAGRKEALEWLAAFDGVMPGKDIVSEKIRMLEYKGKKILCADFSTKTAEGLNRMLDSAAAIIRNSPKRSVLILIEGSSVPVFPTRVMDFKKYVKANQPYIKATAVLNVKGIRRVFFNIGAKIGTRPLKAFEKKEDALEWLADAE
ncbi:MAG: hypothetical protein ACLFP1_05920 [Candidatus Goldiibacteriota bacterium]